MPRGVYDRSKMKNPPVKKAEKIAKVAAAPAGKPGRKPKNQAADLAPAVPVLEQGIGRAGDGIDYSKFHNFGTALQTLTGLRAAIGTTNTALQTKVDEQISKVVVDYVDCLFQKPIVAAPVESNEESAPAPKASAPKANGTVAAPVAQAPVAFNPPAAFAPQS